MYLQHSGTVNINTYSRELLKAGNPVPAIFTGDGKNPCKTPEAGTGGCTRTARGL